MLKNDKRDYNSDWFSVKRMTKDTVQMNEYEVHKWEAHSDGFKISFIKESKPVNLFLKLYYYSYPFFYSGEASLWHNEFLALEELRKRIKELGLDNVDVVPYHLWFTHIKKEWDDNIYLSWIVYDYINLPTVVEANWNGQINNTQYVKYAKLLADINTDKIRDVSDRNAFIDVKKKKIYIFDPILSGKYD
jgi:hypothetical protein